MDPATISLIFMGIRAVSQGLRATGARARFVNELEEFLLGVHREGRTVSAEEVMEWAGKAAASNNAYQQQLAEFLAAIGEAPAPAPQPTPTPPVVQPETPAVPDLGTEG